MILQFEQLLDEHTEGMVVRIGLAEGGEQACWGGEQVWRGVARCGAALAAAAES